MKTTIILRFYVCRVKTYCIVMIYQVSTFFFLKGSLQGNFENRNFKGTAHRFQWIKIEKNWGIMFYTPNEVTAHMTGLKFVKKRLFHPTLLSILERRIRRISPHLWICDQRCYKYMKLNKHQNCPCVFLQPLLYTLNVHNCLRLSCTFYRHGGSVVDPNNIKYGSGSRILAQFGSRSGSRVIL